MSSIQQKLDLKEKEFENRLRACEESNRESLNDLREMLADQQKTHSKYVEPSFLFLFSLRTKDLITL